MAERNPIQAFYEDHPRMVSSPFGGVDGINRDLFLSALQRLEISLEDKQVLDVGCGRGYAGDAVREHGGEYTGLDFVCSRTGFRFAIGDARALPFPDHVFDVVFSIDVCEHFLEPDHAAREVYRVLKPGGILFLSAPNYGNVAGIVKRICEGMGCYEKNTWAPFGRWQRQEFEQPLTLRTTRRIYRAAGFNPLRCVAHGPEVGLGLFPWMDHPRMPEALRFRLQRLFGRVGPGIAEYGRALAFMCSGGWRNPVQR